MLARCRVGFYGNEPNATEMLKQYFADAVVRVTANLLYNPHLHLSQCYIFAYTTD